ncbi:MAG TPA: hypothetical protein VMW42_09950 [Desulfatiglandales bacterium]|nr:hypothetical protein [Desulfatiglandales bacterium]
MKQMGAMNIGGNNTVKSVSKRLKRRLQMPNPMKIKIEFKLQDCWIGFYWRFQWGYYHAWICLIPCLPIHIVWEHKPDIGRYL